MQIEEIPKGGNIELEVKYNGHVMSFRSDIIALAANSVIITPIRVNNQTIGFSDKCQINLLYKTDGKVFIWDDVIVKLVKLNGTISHKIEMSGEGKPYNRRASYRMYIGEDMPLYVNSASGPSAISVLVKDISETGVAFITKDEFDIDRTIRLKLKDNHTVISISGVIIRKEYLEHLESFLYGCRFNEKNNHLGKYIAKRQGDILKRKVSNLSSPPMKDRK